MAQADLDAILKEFLDFGTVKSDISEISNNVKLISSKIIEIEKQLNYLAQQMLEQNNKADAGAQYVTEQIETFSEQIKDKNEINPIKTEQPGSEQAQQKQSNE